MKFKPTILFATFIAAAILGGYLIKKYRQNPSQIGATPYEPLDKSQIQGLDLNGNKIWDEFEPFLKGSFSNGTKSLRAAEKVVQYMQEALLEPSDPLAVAQQLNRADACLEQALEAEHYPDSLIQKVEAAVVNTRIREESYLRYNVRLSGHTFSFGEHEAEGCAYWDN
jgi:hypothetical protein